MKYRVTVNRTAYASIDLTVEADSKEEAEEKAIEEAKGCVMDSHESEYEASAE
jgi:hypothetical protein